MRETTRVPKSWSMAETFSWEINAVSKYPFATTVPAALTDCPIPRSRSAPAASPAPVSAFPRFQLMKPSVFGRFSQAKTKFKLCIDDKSRSTTAPNSWQPKTTTSNTTRKWICRREALCIHSRVFEETRRNFGDPSEGANSNKQSW
jgi:hypothetical protein